MFKHFKPLIPFFCLGTMGAGGALALTPPVLEGPEVFKLDWGTRSLQVADFNGDGLMDLAAINNDNTTIDLLIQLPEGVASAEARRSFQTNRWDPVLEDARFQREQVSVREQLFTLAVGDFNGDGAMDLAYTSRSEGLSLRFQGEDGLWVESQRFDEPEPLGWDRTLIAADIDQNGSTDLVLLARNGLFVWRRGAEDRTDRELTRHLSTVENAFDLVLQDVTGNGLLDALYLVSDGGARIILREQLEPGRFGPEIQMPVTGVPRGLRFVETVESSDAETYPTFGYTDVRSGAIETFRIVFSAPEEAAESGRADLRPSVFPIRMSSGRESALILTADFQKDGMEDVVVVDPASAEVLLFAGSGTGFAPPRRFPSYRGVSSITHGRFGSAQWESLILVSSGEQLIGYSHLDERGRLSFPMPIPLGEAEPLAAKAMDLLPNGQDDLVVLAKDEDGPKLLVLVASTNLASPSITWEIHSELPITGLRRDPTELIAVEGLFGELPALMILTPREPAIFYKGAVEDPGKWVPFAENSALRQNLLRSVSLANLTVLDDPGGLGNVLVVGDRGFARALRVVEDDFEIVDQFNARRSGDVVNAVIPVIEEGDGLVGLRFYVQARGELQTLRREADGVFRYDTTMDVGTIDLKAWVRETGRTEDGQEVLLFFGSDRFWQLPMEGPRWQQRMLARYETDLGEVRYNQFYPVELKAEETSLIAVDANRNLVDVLGRSAESEGRWKSLLFWRVFDQNMHFQGRSGSGSEPREIVSGDFNGDGTPDLAMLVHDRVLFFHQE